MVKTTKVLGTIGFVLTVLFYITILMLPAEVDAKPNIVAV